MPRTKLFDEEETLRKAMQLFWEKGYYGTSVSDLVANLGISRASMYSTFGDKEELFEKAFTAYNQLNKKQVQQVFESHESVKVGFRTLLEGAIEQDMQEGRPKGCMVVNTATELLPEDQKLREKVEQHAHEFKQFFTSQMKKGIKNGEISADKDPEALASYIFTLYSGMKVMSKIHPNRSELLSVMNQGLQIMD